MKIAFLLIGAAAAANVAHVRTAPAALKSMTPTKYGTCKHVGCVSHAGNVHVFHTTNNANGAHGPGTPDPKCKHQASPSASCSSVAVHAPVVADRHRVNAPAGEEADALVPEAVHDARAVHGEVLAFLDAVGELRGRWESMMVQDWLG